MKQYNAKHIEAKWQSVWTETGVYKTGEDASKENYYCLVMFPYPSGDLHTGHWYNFGPGDAVARFNRMQGKNVLHPMGFDAFGLPAENAAIKRGIAPAKWTDQNITSMTAQLKALGAMYDWDKEIITSTPEYYRWTQWLFLLLYKNGLAYRKKGLQNWCPSCQTVLANEQVVGEKNECERCGTPVIKKELEQWFFKITDYADRLLADLGKVQWPERVKTMQENWIGRSEGALISFVVKGQKSKVPSKIEVFTTRPDTLAGATFVVISPELAQKWIEIGWQATDAVKDYLAQAAHKTELDRLETTKDKTGVDTGIVAINPLTGKEVPVWVADYVLGGYGTGAIMAVPAHDERDYEFAKKYSLPIIPVILPEADFAVSYIMGQKDISSADIEAIGGKVVGVSELGHLKVSFPKAKTEAFEELINAKMELGFWNEYISDEAVFIFKHKDGRLERLVLNEDNHNRIRSQGNHFNNEEDSDESVWGWLGGNSYYGEYFLSHKEGRMINSGEFNGLSGTEAKRTIVKRLYESKQGKGETQYRLRDWLISRQRYWGAPIPIVYCDTCGIVPIPEDQLPVELPLDVEFAPTGKSPLESRKDFYETNCPNCSGKAKRETDTMDTFVDSSWYFLRYPNNKYTEGPFDPEAVKKWLPVDQYIGGVEHAILHLLYSRFITKVLYDQKLVDFDEPFKRLFNQGLILGPDGQKMSKSKGNVVNPDEWVERYGADTLRVYLMFMGPYNQGGPFDTQGISGSHRFLQRIWTLTQEFVEAKPVDAVNAAELETALVSATHKTIKRVSEDLRAFGFNTAIAGLMEYVNFLYKHKLELPLGASRAVWQESFGTLLRLLAPLAPHVTEELWEQLGGETSIHVSIWPEYREDLVREELVEIAIQVNGRLRGAITLPPETAESVVIETAKSQTAVQKQITGKTIVKTIVVPRKLVNFVVK